MANLLLKWYVYRCDRSAVLSDWRDTQSRSESFSVVFFYLRLDKSQAAEVKEEDGVSVWAGWGFIWNQTQLPLHESLSAD